MTRRRYTKTLHKNVTQRRITKSRDVSARRSCATPLLDVFFLSYIAASSPPHCWQYHSVGRFIVPQALQRSVRSPSSASPAAAGSGTIGAGIGLAARGAEGLCWRGTSAGTVGWNCAPLARRGDGAVCSSSVTDLMNASSSSCPTFSGSGCGLACGGWGACAGGGAARGGGVGRWLTSASNSSGLWLPATTDCRSPRTDTTSASTSPSTCSHCDSSYSPTEWRSSVSVSFS